MTNGVHHIEELVRIGLLKEDEAEHLIEEIEEDLQAINDCTDDIENDDNDNKKDSDSDASSSDGDKEEVGEEEDRV